MPEKLSDELQTLLVLILNWVTAEACPQNASKWRNDKAGHRRHWQAIEGFLRYQPAEWIGIREPTQADRDLVRADVEELRDLGFLELQVDSIQRLRWGGLTEVGHAMAESIKKAETASV
jgi:hypothetical protein